jgi:hypothetical protein
MVSRGLTRCLSCATSGDTERSRAGKRSKLILVFIASVKLAPVVA